MKPSQEIKACILVGADKVAIARLVPRLVMSVPGYKANQKYIGRVASLCDTATLIAYARATAARVKFFVIVHESLAEIQRNKISLDANAMSRQHEFFPLCTPGANWQTFLYHPDTSQGKMYVWEKYVQSGWTLGDPRNGVDVACKWFSFVTSTEDTLLVTESKEVVSLPDMYPGHIQELSETVIRARLQEFYMGKHA